MAVLNKIWILIWRSGLVFGRVYLRNVNVAVWKWVVRMERSGKSSAVRYKDKAERVYFTKFQSCVIQKDDMD